MIRPSESCALNNTVCHGGRRSTSTPRRRPLGSPARRRRRRRRRPHWAHGKSIGSLSVSVSLSRARAPAHARHAHAHALSLSLSLSVARPGRPATSCHRPVRRRDRFGGGGGPGSTPKKRLPTNITARTALRALSINTGSQ